MEKNQIYLYMSLWGEHGGAPGMALFSFDLETGAIGLIRKLDEEHSFGPSVIDTEKRILYVCNETNLEFETGYDTGRIHGFQIENSTGNLTELFRQETYCPFPDYIGFSTDKKYMIVPHHSWARSITEIEKNAEGNVELINKEDCLPTGQKANCEQGFCMSSDGQYLYNLLNGYNSVAVLEINQEDGSISLKQNVMVEGAKPRNCNLSPNGKFLITACLTGEIAVYAVGDDGCLTLTPHKEFMKGSAYINFYQP